MTYDCSTMMIYSHICLEKKLYIPSFINLMKELKPSFEDDLKFVWTDSDDAMSKRHILGVTW